MHSELDQAPVFPIRVDGVAAEEHRVPTVSRLELGGGQQGQEDRERGRKWGESFRAGLPKGAHSSGDHQGHLLQGGRSTRGFVKGSSSQKVPRLELWKSPCREGLRDLER